MSVKSRTPNAADAPDAAPQPDWRGKIYDAASHQWVDAPPPASAQADTPAATPAPVQE